MVGKSKKANVTTATIETKDIDENTVYVYNSKQSLNVPCVSPLCLALETYLRMTKTEYKKASNEKKVDKMHGDPKIMLNRQEYCGLETCFENVGKTFPANLDHLADVGLSEEQKADAEAFVKASAEAVLFWILSALRSKKPQDGSGAHDLMKRIRNGAQQLLKGKEIDDRSVAKMSMEDLSKKAKDTLTALSNYIQRDGQKKFFFGDKPTKFDSILFGVLAQFYFDPPTELNLKEYMDEHTPKLAGYLNHVKGVYWSDWAECCTLPPPPPAVKTETKTAADADNKTPAVADTTTTAHTNGEPTVNGAPPTVVVSEKKSPAEEQTATNKVVEDSAAVVVTIAEAPIAAADASTPSGEIAVNGI